VLFDTPRLLMSAIPSCRRIIRWISEVRSKMVKIVDYSAVSAVQRAADSVVSAQVR